MPVITSIKPQRNQKRANIYLDGKFGFGIDLINLAMLHLKVDQELSEKKVEEIIRKAEFQKILDKLLKFASLRPRSEKEVRDYFRRKKIHESVIPDLIEKLKHFELLDDEKFARWWIDQRVQFKSKSKKDITFELRNKGIGREVVEKSLEEAPIDEEKAARRLMEKKGYKWAGLSPRDYKIKASRYLSSKGFSWDVIEKVVSKVVK